MKATYDSKRCFLDVDISHHGATSNFISFHTSPFQFKFEKPGLLHPDFAVYGAYMVTPFKGVLGGSKDAFNFYQSQLWITIECAFRMLVHRFGIL
jgi:hypothetical protein